VVPQYLENQVNDKPVITSWIQWLTVPEFSRYCLNYKEIPYQTECVEFPDIAPLCKELGIPPTGIKIGMGLSVLSYLPFMTLRQGYILPTQS